MTNFTVTLTGQLPSGKNAVLITRTGQRYPAARFREWRSEALRQLRPQLHGQVLPIQGPVTLIIDYVPSDQRRRDMPGMLDAICHLLEKAGVLLDDAQVVNLNWRRFAMAKGKGQATVTILA